MELRRSLAGVGPDTPLAGTHSWLRPRKGIDIFLRSVPIIMRSIPRAHFIIAGKAESPAYEQELRQLVRSMSATDRVQFLGFRSDIPDILAALDVFVMPSLCGEGSPFALLEAMAASRIVIATRTEGNDEIIQSGSTGILVSPGDPEAIARALIDVLNDTGYQRKLGAGARRAVTERFSVERMTAETEAFYLRILSVRISR